MAEKSEGSVSFSPPPLSACVPGEKSFFFPLKRLMSDLGGRREGYALPRGSPATLCGGVYGRVKGYRRVIRGFNSVQDSVF